MLKKQRKPKRSVNYLGCTEKSWKHVKIHKLKIVGFASGSDAVRFQRKLFRLWSEESL